MSETVLYHGSKELVEFPEIRMARYTARALTALKFLKGYKINNEE